MMGRTCRADPAPAHREALDTSAEDWIAETRRLVEQHRQARRAFWSDGAVGPETLKRPLKHTVRPC